MPLAGFEVSAAPSGGEKPEVRHAFRLSHTQQTLLLSAPDAELQAKWVEVLSSAAAAAAAAGSEAPGGAAASVTEHGRSQ